MANYPLLPPPPALLFLLARLVLLLLLLLFFRCRRHFSLVRRGTSGSSHFTAAVRVAGLAGSRGCARPIR